MITNGKIQLYILPRIAAWLILGIFFGYMSYGILPVWVWLSAMCAFVVGACFVKSPLPNSILLMAGVLSFGGMIIGVRLTHLNRDFLPRKAVYQAVISSRPVERGKVVRCDLLVLDAGQSYKIQASILRDTLTEHYRRISVGDGIEFYAQIEDLSSRQNPNSNFNYFLWLQAQNVVGQAFIHYSSWRKVALDISSLPLVQRVRLTMLRLREKMVGQLADSGMEGQQQAIVAAMALGDRSALEKSTREMFSISGASHVLALSGLHLSIIYCLGIFLFRRRRSNQIFQVLTLTAIWAYATLVGLAPSVVRAATMLTVYGLLDVIHRTHIPLNALALAAVIMLLGNPLMLWDVGFQMSFMSVLGIFVFYRPLFHVFGELHQPIVRIVWGMICVSCSAQIGVFPLVMYYFGRFSCYFILTNFVAIPAVWLVLSCVLAFFVFSFSSVLQAFLASFLQMVVGGLQVALEWISSLPFSSFDNISISSLQVVMLYGIIGCLYGIVYYLRKGYVQAGLRRFR